MDIEAEVKSVLKEYNVRYADKLAKKISEHLASKAQEDEVVKQVLSRMTEPQKIPLPEVTINGKPANNLTGVLAAGVAVAAAAYLLKATKHV